MTIGSTIRQLRQEQDITQEQLAEALGITSRAVSQWETDRTSPDISQLPALANFFDVTTDRLLGLDIKRKKEELDKIYVQINRYNEIGDQKGLEEFIREQLKTYPNDPNLLTHLAFALQNYYFGHGKADTEELKKEKSNEIITLCERALKYYSVYPCALTLFQPLNSSPYRTYFLPAYLSHQFSKRLTSTRREPPILIAGKVSDLNSLYTCVRPR